MEQKQQNTITDIINELKRLQVEHGDISVVSLENDEGVLAVPFPAWPIYNEKENRVEF
jgi:hypothetical protein